MLKKKLWKKKNNIKQKQHNRKNGFYKENSTKQDNKAESDIRVKKGRWTSLER